MGVIRLLDVATTPGAEGGNPFTPPAGWQGDAAAYMALMRERYKQIDLGIRMYVAARQSRRASAVYTGPYAAEAKAIIRAIIDSSFNQPKA
jgi:hypothetical protein